MCVCVCVCVMWTVSVTAVFYSTDLPSQSQECLLRLSDVRRRIMVNILVYRDLQVFLLEQRVGWWAEGVAEIKRCKAPVRLKPSDELHCLLLPVGGSSVDKNWVFHWMDSTFSASRRSCWCFHSTYIRPLPYTFHLSKWMYAIVFDAKWNGGGRFFTLRLTSFRCYGRSSASFPIGWPTSKPSVSVIIPPSSELMRMIVGEDFICMLRCEGVASHTFCVACK